MLTFGVFGILIVHATDGLAFAVQRARAAGAAERTVMSTIIPRSVMVHSIALGRDAVKPAWRDHRRAHRRRGRSALRRSFAPAAARAGDVGYHIAGFETVTIVYEG